MISYIPQYSIATDSLIKEILQLMQLPLNRLLIVRTIYADSDTGGVSTIKNKQKSFLTAMLNLIDSLEKLQKKIFYYYLNSGSHTNKFLDAP